MSSSEREDWYAWVNIPILFNIDEKMKWFANRFFSLNNIKTFQVQFLILF